MNHSQRNFLQKEKFAKEAIFSLCGCPPKPRGKKQFDLSKIAWGFVVTLTMIYNIYVQCLINVLVLFYFIWQVVISNHSALCKAFLINVVRSKLQAYVTKSNGMERNKVLLHVLNKKKNAFQMFSFSDMETRYCSVSSPDLNLVKHLSGRERGKIREEREMAEKIREEGDNKGKKKTGS